MAPASTLQTAVTPTKISFPGKTKMEPKTTVLVSGQDAVFLSEKECIMHFDNEKVFGTSYVRLAANTEKVLTPVTTSEKTNIYIKALKDGPDGNTG